MEAIGVKKTKDNSFSKSIMAVMMLLYFMGAVIGAILVIVSAIVDIKYRQMISTEMFIAYAAYLGAPTLGAVGFYGWKSKAENILKIRQSFLKENKQNNYEQMSMDISTLANMRGD